VEGADSHCAILHTSPVRLYLVHGGVGFTLHYFSKLVIKVTTMVWTLCVNNNAYHSFWSTL